MDLDDLNEPLREFARRWAASPLRPRPRAVVLHNWDEFLGRWAESDLPLLFRKGSLNYRGSMTTCASGRPVLFGDNSPANWAIALALEDEVPALSE